MEGNLRFKIDWASLIAGSKFTVFALSWFCIWGQFPTTSPPWGLYLEGRFNGGFLALPVWGAYDWRGLFSEFYGSETCPRPYWCTNPVLWHLNSFPCNNFLLFQKTNVLIHWSRRWKRSVVSDRYWAKRSWFLNTFIVESLSNDGSNGRENLTFKKVNFRSLPELHCYSVSELPAC